MYLVTLPRNKVLSVPRNMKLLAVPLFELYDNANRYGSQLSAIPLYLSRYNFEFVDSNDRVIGTYASDSWRPSSVPATLELSTAAHDDSNSNAQNTSTDGKKEEFTTT